MRLSIIAAGGILVACVGAASAQTSVDRTFKADGQDCAAVQWSKELLREYPGIGAACQAVERREGTTYVKFTGTVRQVSDDGKVKIDFKQGDTLTLAPPADTVLYMDGRKTPISQLRRGTVLNFYVAENRLTAQFLAEGAEPVEVPIVREQVVAREQPPPADRQLVAQNLPATASGLPLMAWAAVIFLMLGAAMTLYRNSR